MAVAATSPDGQTCVVAAAEPPGLFGGAATGSSACAADLSGGAGGAGGGDGGDDKKWEGVLAEFIFFLEHRVLISSLLPMARIQRRKKHVYLYVYSWRSPCSLDL